MARQADINAAEEREVRLENMIEEFRAAQKRALVRRGIVLWKRSEVEWRLAHGAARPSHEVNAGCPQPMNGVAVAPSR